MADDLISRQAVLDILKFKPIDDGGVVDDCIMQVLALAKSKVNKLPAVDAAVLPCKVGDTIYRCGDPIKKAYEWQIEHIEIYFDETVFVDDSDNTFTVDDIGKTVFLTREEAEEELKRREENAAD